MPVIRVDRLNFVHTQEQKDRIMRYVLEFKKLGASGVVVGAHATRKDGEVVIDTEFLRRWFHVQNLLHY